MVFPASVLCLPKDVHAQFGTQLDKNHVYFFQIILNVTCQKQFTCNDTIQIDVNGRFGQVPHVGTMILFDGSRVLFRQHVTDVVINKFHRRRQEQVPAAVLQNDYLQSEVVGKGILVLDELVEVVGFQRLDVAFFKLC